MRVPLVSTHAGNGWTKMTMAITAIREITSTIRSTTMEAKTALADRFFFLAITKARRNSPRCAGMKVLAA
jgi:hypothetical protein